MTGIGALATLSLSALAGTPEYAAGDSDKDRFVGPNSGYVIIMNTATWCGPCRKTHPAWHSACGAVSGVRYVEVDVDKCPNWSSVGGSGVPNFVMYKNGTPLKRITGGVYNPDEITNFINDMISQNGPASSSSAAPDAALTAQVQAQASRPQMERAVHGSIVSPTGWTMIQLNGQQAWTKNGKFVVQSWDSPPDAASTVSAPATPVSAPTATQPTSFILPIPVPTSDQSGGFVGDNAALVDLFSSPTSSASSAPSPTCAPGDINCQNALNYAYKTGQYTGDWKPAILDGKYKFRNEKTGEWRDTYPGMNGLSGLGALSAVARSQFHEAPDYTPPVSSWSVPKMAAGLGIVGGIGYLLYKATKA